MEMGTIMNCEISVIIPVYNGEKYLRQALDSVMTQTFKNFELVAVNDGSNDSSLNILQEYKNKFENMVIINQNNAGVSTARNVAMSSASGKYICFLDADDICHPDFLASLYSNLKKFDADVAFCEYQVFYGSKCQFPNSQTIEAVSIKEIYEEKSFDYIMKLGLGTALWNKLYRRDFLLKNGISFNKKSSFGEDMFFNWKASIVANNIIYVKQVLYGYRLSSEAATTKYHPDLFEKYCNEFNVLLEFGKQHKQDILSLENSIYLNLAERIPSFLMMNLRRNTTLYQKYQYVYQLASNEKVQRALDIWSKSRIDTKNKSVQYYLINKKYFKVFLKSLVSEVHFKLARKIKNMK